MAPSKAPSKKQKKGGIDFKKIKRKIGRKLPPAKNATNTEIKSKAIILPEQSVAADKVGLAVNKRGLTLKELLQQSSHRNAKVRKDALMGIRDLLLANPLELSLHKYAVIEKLRERVGDDDKAVRETLYQLFKSVIFPGCNEEYEGMFVSLLMTYIFHAMTNFAVEVRVTAFRFLELVVQHYPDSLFQYAEKIFHNYGDMLQMNKFYFQEKGKLKTILSGLLHCLSLLPPNKEKDASAEKKVVERRVLHALEPDTSTESDGCSAIIPIVKDLVPILLNYFEEYIPSVKAAPLYDAQSFDCMLCLLQSINLSIKFYLCFTYGDNLKLWSSYKGLDANVWAKTISTVISKKLIVVFPLNPVHRVSEKGAEMYYTLNSTITEIFLYLSEWISPAVSLEHLFEFIESALLGKSDTRSAKSVQEKILLPLLPFIPQLVSQLSSDWKSRLLKAFTKAFTECKPQSSLKLACIPIIEQMICPTEAMVYLVPDILDHQISWMRELSELLLLCENNQSCGEAVVRLLRHIAVSCGKNPSLACEFEFIQYSLRELYITRLDDGSICSGPFVRLPSETQMCVLAINQWFHSLDPPLLSSITQCCLCPDLNPRTLSDIIDNIRECYYVAGGNLDISHFLKFLVTLQAEFRVSPENIFPFRWNDSNSRSTFKLVCSKTLSYIKALGDNSILLWIVEDVILEKMSAKPPLYNFCAMLWLLVELMNLETTKRNVPAKLSPHIVTSLGNLLPGYLMDLAHCIPKHDEENSMTVNTWRHFISPCISLFCRNQNLLHHTLTTLASLITETCQPHTTLDRMQYATEVSNTVDEVVSILHVMHVCHTFQKILSSFKEDIHHILQNIVCLQSSKEIDLSLEGKQKVQSAIHQVEEILSSLN
ncbi:uncharacterized protein LOC115714916 isoform X1 [Cannabis sativa]|uniref:uncharacterized protein LOC115714916 isoform X1 n=2 Tax=Cannabis sativa TaxID=3483 RepID=UPI0029C9B5E1|nr:uncharacterized protein LOC115714916 isoform X1 [Cannabis sativa]XP_030499535.2 uncharacterized protein LOC115714916 isoform X1 [Cannabis sativa]